MSDKINDADMNGIPVWRRTVESACPFCHGHYRGIPEFGGCDDSWHVKPVPAPTYKWNGYKEGERFLAFTPERAAALLAAEERANKAEEDRDLATWAAAGARTMGRWAVEERAIKAETERDILIGLLREARPYIDKVNMCGNALSAMYAHKLLANIESFEESEEIKEPEVNIGTYTPVVGDVVDAADDLHECLVVSVTPKVECVALYKSSVPHVGTQRFRIRQDARWKRHATQDELREASVLFRSAPGSVHFDPFHVPDASGSKE